MKDETKKQKRSAARPSESTEHFLTGRQLPAFVIAALLGALRRRNGRRKS
jgi:hypothetical protein